VSERVVNDVRTSSPVTRCWVVMRYNWV